ncbi:MAG: DUF6470 family protein [Anaerofustis sp.]
MEQLLRIQQIPIAFEFKVTHAQYRATAQPAQLNITRQDGGLKISRQRGQLYLDTTASRDSMGLKTNAQLVKQFAEDGKQAAYAATSSIAKEGDLMADYYKVDNPIALIAAQNIRDNVEVGLDFIPSVPVSIDYIPEELNMKYQADKLQFDWRTNTDLQTDYIPGNIDYAVKEYPHVNIEYVGGFIYVPKSANPNYSESTSSGFTATA